MNKNRNKHRLMELIIHKTDPIVEFRSYGVQELRSSKMLGVGVNSITPKPLNSSTPLTFYALRFTIYALLLFLPTTLSATITFEKTVEPIIVSAFPSDNALILNPFYGVYAVIQSYDTVQSYIEVQNLDGSPINGTKRFNGDTMFFDFLDTFAIDGSDNGVHNWYIYAILDTVTVIDTLTFIYNVDLFCMAPVIDSGIPAGNSTIAESLYITGHSDSAAYDSLIVQNGDSIYTAGVIGNDATGVFRFNFPLWYGDNHLSLWSVDTYGNRSDTTKVVVKRTSMGFIKREIREVVSPMRITTGIFIISLPYYINYRIGWKSDISLDIYDNIGRKIETLFKGEREAGDYRVKFNKQLPAGVYFIRLRYGRNAVAKKIVVIK